MLDRLTLSALDWWEEAGVDAIVDDVPRDWLAPAAPPPPIAAPAAKPAGTLPQDLPGFRTWLLESGDVPGSRAARVPGCGDPASGTMLIVDMPEAGDRSAGRLLANATGELLDRMLAAMGLSRDTTYIAPFSPARPASGRLDAAAVAALAPIALHHVALARPHRLLLMGDAPVRALLGLGANEARGRTHILAPEDVPVIATYPPRFILQADGQDRKERRAAVWNDLQQFMALR